MTRVSKRRRSVQAAVPRRIVAETAAQYGNRSRDGHNTEPRVSIVALERFIEATRDSGYKGTQSAIAELVDNALQAAATKIVVLIEPDANTNDGSLRIEVVDNGSGMDEDVLQQALRFGGSTRFNDRHGLGRYGMGLPNSSLSQARRVDVCTWRPRSGAVSSFLDVDAIAAGTMVAVPAPVRSSRPQLAIDHGFESGTSVVWSRCDRLDHRRPSTIAKKLRSVLGRVFRYFLWNGVTIEVNGEVVQAIDPLFLHKDSLTHDAQMYQAPLEYDLEVPLPDAQGEAVGKVVVTFSELPVERWHALSNDEKHRLGVLKAAGVSVVRADREIDYGWFFMGNKRRENYDDWWRCEIRFPPSLDEVFGITHTKQQLRPTAELLQVLSPDLEATAKALNRRVRQIHERLKIAARVSDSEAAATSSDHLLPGLREFRPSPATQQALASLEKRHPRIAKQVASGDGQLQYALVEGDVGGTRFFRTYRRAGQLVLALNTDHPFYRRCYRVLVERTEPDLVALRQQLDLVLLAATRSEAAVGAAKSRRFLETWSNTIATFLR
jgi:hypothetical protein